METVQKLQDIQLGILAVVDRLCRRHNLTYYLAEGTLLGAVRHEGFGMMMWILSCPGRTMKNSSLCLTSRRLKTVSCSTSLPIRNTT